MVGPGQGRVVRLEQESKQEREGVEVRQVGKARSWKPLYYLLFPPSLAA